jgi:hypothetical protein
MAATTYLQIRNEIAAIGPFDTAAQTTRVGLWANDAQHWFLSKRRWSFLETSATVASVSGQADYVLAGTSPIVTDFGQLIDISHNQANAGTTFVKLRFSTSRRSTTCSAWRARLPARRSSTRCAAERRRRHPRRSSAAAARSSPSGR